ncbi:MAG TPA: rod shape-determining protein MreD [Candidatus Merdenecus merdavium]|nr:rod shape-determining protein MreD [Candidatus Merdenecus merdavium]
MKRKITIAAMIIICFILQSTIFHTLAVGSIKPNLLIILVSSFGFMKGKKEGLIIGFICGLLIDIFYGSVVGLNALIYMYIGYLNGFFSKIFYDEDIKLPMILITASDFLYGFLTYVFLFLLRGRLNFGYYLSKIIIPEIVYTVLVTIVLYRIILIVNYRLEDGRKRGSNRFV